MFVLSVCRCLGVSPAPDLPPAALKNPDSVLAALRNPRASSFLMRRFRGGNGSAFLPDLFCRAVAIAHAVTLLEPAPAACNFPLTTSWTPQSKTLNGGRGGGRHEKMLRGGVVVRNCWGQGTREKFPTPQCEYFNNHSKEGLQLTGGETTIKHHVTNKFVNLPWHFCSDVSMQFFAMSINKAQQWQTVTLEVAGPHLFKPDFSHGHFYFACSSQTPYKCLYKESAQKCSHHSHKPHINPAYFISHNHNLLSMFTCYQSPDHDQVTDKTEYPFSKQGAQRTPNSIAWVPVILKESYPKVL